MHAFSGFFDLVVVSSLEAIVNDLFVGATKTLQVLLLRAFITCLYAMVVLSRTGAVVFMDENELRACCRD